MVGPRFEQTIMEDQVRSYVKRSSFAIVPKGLPIGF